MSPKAKTLADLFWPKVRFGDDCWLWTGGVINRGYGLVQISVDKKRRLLLAHRASWLLTRGPIPTGLFVCHTCDNPPCVRPDHLFLGTNRDNMRDCFAKGRAHGAFKPGHRRGSTNKFAKLTEATVRTIRERRASGTTGASLARELGVDEATISKVALRKTWRWLA